MLLDDIAQHLEDQGHGTVGTDIFKGALVESPDQQIAVIEAPGFPPIRRMGDTGSPVFERPSFQIVVRGARDDYSAARTLANDCWKEFASLKASTLNSVAYSSVEAQHSPFDGGNDESERPLIICTYIAWKAPT